jgi:hypothetical protein
MSQSPQVKARGLIETSGTVQEGPGFAGTDFLPSAVHEPRFALPRRLRPGRADRGWLVGLFVLALALSLVTGAMAIALRGAQDIAHYLATVRAWGADAYSCAVVGGIALVAWAAFFAATVRRIREAKLAPPFAARTMRVPGSGDEPDEQGADRHETAATLAVGPPR